MIYNKFLKEKIEKTEDLVFEKVQIDPEFIKYRE